MPKLKVFRTPIGFHDAYIAAPSQKAALEAWGADSNLFARGVAEIVTDPKLTGEPLAKPGVVIKRLRGSAAEHMAALPREPRRQAVTHRPASQAVKGFKTAPKPKPRPSRQSLDNAEQALEALEARHGKALERIAKEEARVAKERRSLEQAHAAEIAKFDKAIAAARRRYDHSMMKWRES